MKWTESKLLFLAVLCCSADAAAAVWRVGPSRTYTRCSQVMNLVRQGDTVDIDSAVYTNDLQVTWNADNLLIRGVNGRPRLVAGSLIANDATNGKGIFVIRGNNVTVENIEFRDAVVLSHNGAGIRQEGRNLKVRYCKFQGNEMGILSGNIPNCTILIEYSEFLQGGSNFDPGYQHNIYINHIDSFIFRYNFSHDAIASGHELKSRATHNIILYNRLANINTEDSRTIDLPNGGFALVMGNVIEQGPNSSNTNLLGYGLEGLSNPGPHALLVIHNTFVNKKDRGSFIHVAATGVDTLMLRNNILAGAKTGGLIIGNAGVLDSAHNLICDRLADAGFVDAAAFNYRLAAGSRAIDGGRAVSGRRRGYPLIPAMQYRDDCRAEVRPSDGSPDIGAFERPGLTGLVSPDETVISLYPNPTSGVLYLRPGNRFNAVGPVVFDAQGRSINTCRSTQLPDGLWRFDTEDLKPGTYWIRSAADPGFSLRFVRIP